MSRFADGVQAEFKQFGVRIQPNWLEECLTSLGAHSHAHADAKKIFELVYEQFLRSNLDGVAQPALPADVDSYRGILSSPTIVQVTAPIASSSLDASVCCHRLLGVWSGR